MTKTYFSQQRGANGMSRRAALKMGAGAAFTSTLGAPSILRAQSGPIRIGHLTPMTGFLGTLGQWAVDGIQMAADEINEAGGINGRQVEVQSEDSINPVTGANKAQRMIDRDNVDFLMGEISSATSLAISEVAERNQKLFMALGPRSDVLRGERCSRYMFCTDIPNTAMVNAVGSAIDRRGMVDGKTFFALTADYVFGHDLLDAAESYISENGGEIGGNALVATDVTDFSPFILKIRQAQPDVLALNLAGNQVTNFVKQYAGFGLQTPMIGFNLNTADAWTAGIGTLSGTWPTVWLHTLDTPGSQEFVQAFRQRYDKIPENHAWIEYIALKQVAAKAIAEVGGPDTAGMIDFFEGDNEFDILKERPAYFRAADHQLIQEAYPFTVKKTGTYDDVHDMLELGPPVPTPDRPLESIYPSTEGGACEL